MDCRLYNEQKHLASETSAGLSSQKRHFPAPKRVHSTLDITSMIPIKDIYKNSSPKRIVIKCRVKTIIIIMQLGNTSMQKSLQIVTRIFCNSRREI